MLTELEPGKTFLDLRGRAWRGLYGPEGYIGHKPASYCAALEGIGPVFRDPAFDDFATNKFGATGTITVDQKQKRVIVEMSQILSKPGLSLKLKDSPANGTYTIIEESRSSEGKKRILERFDKMTSSKPWSE